MVADEKEAIQAISKVFEVLSLDLRMHGFPKKPLIIQSDGEYFNMFLILHRRTDEE